MPISPTYWFNRHRLHIAPPALPILTSARHQQIIPLVPEAPNSSTAPSANSGKPAGLWWLWWNFGGTGVVLFFGGGSAANTKVWNFGLIENPLNKKTLRKISDSIFQLFICLSGTSRMPLASYAETPQPQQPMWSRFSCLGIITSGHWLLVFTKHATFRTVFLDSSLALTLMVWGAAPFVCGRFAGNFSPGSFQYQEVGISWHI